MKLIFVNHCHPDTPHVCGTRQREFAKASAAAGHHVVLLTETLPGQPSSATPASLPAALDHHDWRVPFRLGCAPTAGRLIAAAREGRLAAPLRKPLIAAEYLVRGGLFTDWRDASRPYWDVLANAFRPDAVWASFGNTDVWAIGRGIARLARCPWVMDIKDPWSVFIPAALRKILAARFTDFAGATALSAGHANDAARWFTRAPTVVYSGIDESFLPAPRLAPARRRLLIVGALYDERHLVALVEGIGRWARGGEEIVYAGGEGERFFAAARQLADRVQLETPGFIGLDYLRTLAAGAAALLYVRNPTALYQHKLIELLAMDRPVFCLPGESAESRTIAEGLGGRLISCDSAEELAIALEQEIGARHPGINRARLADFTWSAQSQRLLDVLKGNA